MGTRPILKPIRNHNRVINTGVNWSLDNIFWLESGIDFPPVLQRSLRTRIVYSDVILGNFCRVPFDLLKSFTND